MRANKTFYWAGLTAFGLGVVATLAAERRQPAEDDLYRQLKPLMESMALIQNSYVDEDKVKSKELVQGAIKGMMGQLDPFSQYLDPEEHTDMKQDRSEERRVGKECRCRWSEYHEQTSNK